MERLVFLSARNLGDAVFHASFLRALADAGFARRYLVWTFPAAAFLFVDIRDVQVVTSSFPIGATLHRFLRGGVVGALRALRRVRAWQPNATLELVADHRERLLCRLTGAPRALTPEWPPSHGFRRHNRIPRRPVAGLPIPETAHNIYAAYDHLLQTLVGRSSPMFTGDVPRTAPADKGSIGIHCFASAAFKLWPPGHWREAMRQLADAVPGCRFVLFGTPSDRPALEALSEYGGAAPCEIVVGSLPAFRDRLARTELLIGLDSFSVHLAHSLGVPSVTLVGANDPHLFTPPSAAPVYRRSDCAYQPCGGKPRCVGTSFEYTCMKTITPGAVKDATTARIHRSSLQ